MPYGYGAKTAYKHIDCSGFCVATQIQENGGPLISDGHIIDLDCTSADMLVRDIKPGVHTTIQINDADAWRGDMIGLDRSLPEWNHIANVAYVEYNPGEGEFDIITIYEAIGQAAGMPGLLNRVRYEDAKACYLDREPPYNYQHKVVRWDY